MNIQKPEEDSVISQIPLEHLNELTRHSILRRQDTTEDQTKREQQVCNVTAILGRLVEGDDKVGECAGEEEESPHQEEHREPSDVNVVAGVLVESDRVVPGEEDEDRHETVPRNFDENVGQHEYFPTVRLGRTLSNLIEISLGSGKSQKQD
jgi:hypothetical protein